MKEKQHPRARLDCLSRELDDEVLVYDPQDHVGHCLNPTVTAVWKLCDGKHNTSQITTELTRQLPTRMDESLVRLALQQLADARLLIDSESKMTFTSRRAVIRRIGIASAIALPLITSIVAPTPANAVTCLHNLQPCTANAQCCSHICDQLVTHRCIGG